MEGAGGCGRRRWNRREEDGATVVVAGRGASAAEVLAGPAAVGVEGAERRWRRAPATTLSRVGQWPITGEELFTLEGSGASPDR